MKEILTGLKSITTVLTASVSLFMENPIWFLTRVYRRVAGARDLRICNFDTSSFEQRAALSKVNELPATQRGIQKSEISTPQRERLSVLLYLNNSEPFTRSGYTERTNNLLTCMADLGVLVSAATRLGYPAVIGRITRNKVDYVNGIRFHRLIPWVFRRQPMDRFEDEFELLKKIAIEESTTILHTTTPFGNAELVSAVANELGIPWIYEVRGEPEKTWLSKVPRERQAAAEASPFFQSAQEYETLAMRNASKVIALSEVSKDMMVLRGVSEEKIVVVPNSLDHIKAGEELTSDMAAGWEIKKSLGLERKKLLGSISSIVGYEGLDILIRSIVHLSDDWHVLIVGDGEQKPLLQRLCAQLEVQDRVTFVDRQPSTSIDSWYSALDVFALPRRDELVCRSVTPIKPLKAMSLGLPIVSSDMPALREVTGNFGYYFTPEDPQALAESVEKAWGSKYPEVVYSWLENRTWKTQANVLKALYETL